MILNDFTVPKTKYSNEQLDAVLVELCEIILEGKQDNPDFYGSVSAAVIDPKGRLVTGLNYVYGNYRIHAERAAIDKYEAEYGELPKGSIVVTTLSPCSDRMDSRYEESCADLLNSKGIKLAYCGYNDPTQENTQDKFVTIITENSKLKALCKKFADTFLKKHIDENFADGKGPGRPGDSQRHGISKGASMAELEKASHSKGRKGQLARWQLNMRRGHKK
jgi:pyrimidine deaminase RibD-like protein